MTATCLLSVWGDLISKIISGKTYKISSVSLGNFSGPKLSTSYMTEITEVKDLNVKWDATPIKKVFAKNVELSNVLIVGVKTNVFLHLHQSKL